MPTIIRIFQIFLFSLLACAPSAAEPVSVNRGAGLGYVFKHRGNCYLILPNHVRQHHLELSIASSAPQAFGDAEVFRSYAPELDFAVAIVTNGFTDRCIDNFQSLQTNLQPTLSSSTTAQLIRVDSTGIEERDDMVITSFDFENITATVKNPARAEIYQGTSGGILRIGNAVVGMAIQSENTQEARFLRSDEIYARLQRLLDNTTGQIRPVATTAEAAATPANNLCPPSRLVPERIECSAEPLSPEQSCKNLLTGGTTAFPHTSIAPRIIIDLPGTQPITINSVTLGSSASSTDLSKPKGIIVEISSAKGAPLWRRFGAGDMPPTGKLQLVSGAAPFASQISITLQSSWEPELPVSIDCLAFN
jgi:hypothetical protein